MSVFTYNELSSFLKNQLHKKQLKNPAYSLRSFARDLDVASSSLSDLMNSKAKGSKASLDKIFSNLKVSAFEETYLRLIHAAQYAIDESSKNEAIKEAQKIKDLLDIELLTEEQFLEVTSWITLAVIELLPIPPFNKSPFLMAEQLGIDQNQVQESLDSLIKNNLIYKSNEGLFCTHPNAQIFLSKMPNQVAKKLHEEIMKINMDTLWTTPPESRVNISTLLMIDEENIPQIQEEIQNFLIELINRQSKKPQKNKLYSLSLHLNPIKKGPTNEIH